MHMIKSGFTLIEILVATAIAAMLSAALFMSLYQINQTTTVIDDFTDEPIKAGIVQTQLERDLIGAFVPVAATVEDQVSTTTTEQKQPDKAGKSTSQEKKEPLKNLKKVFYGTAKDGKLDQLTFITSNPLQVFWSKKTGKAKPRIARVIYRLVKDKEEKSSYTLTRQEGTDLKYEAYAQGSTKTSREFPIVEGIKNLSVEYMAEQKSDDKEGTSKNKTYKTYKEWNKESKEKKDAKKEEQLIPDFVVLKTILWDVRAKRESLYEYKIPLNASASSPARYRTVEDIMAEYRNKPKDEKKNEPQKTEGAPNATTPGVPIKK